MKRSIQILTVLGIVSLIVPGYFLFVVEKTRQWETVDFRSAALTKKETGRNRLKKLLFLNEIYQGYDELAPLVEKPEAIKKHSVNLAGVSVSAENEKSEKVAGGEAEIKGGALLVRGHRIKLTVDNIKPLLQEHRPELMELEILPSRKTAIEVLGLGSGEMSPIPVHRFDIEPDKNKQFKSITFALPESFDAERIVIKVTPGGKKRKVRVKFRGIYLMNRMYKALEHMPRLADLAYSRGQLRHMQALQVPSRSRFSVVLDVDPTAGNTAEPIIIDGYLGSFDAKPLTFQLLVNGEEKQKHDIVGDVPFFRIKANPRQGKLRFTAAVTGAPDGIGALANITFYRPFKKDERKNVVYYLIDALRADFSGIDKSMLENYFKDGAVFTSAYANATRTADSLPSLFAGKYKFMLVHKNSDVPRLPEEEFLLAEYFKSKGYTTAAFSSNPWLKKSNSNQGFDFMDICYGYMGGGKIFPTHEQYIDFKYGDMDSHIKEFVRLHKNKPLFIYIHTIEPHTPYESPVDGRRYSAGADKATLKLLYRSFTLSPIEPTLKNPTPHQLNVVKNLYKDQIQLACDFFADMHRHLENQGVINPLSLVILTADHGERFYEHRSWIHGPPDVYNEVLHIPFMIKGPGIAAGKYSQNVQLVDIYPTLMEWLGDKPARPLVGNSLLALVGDNTNKKTFNGRPIYSDGTGAFIQFSYVKDNIKVIIDHKKVEVYRLDLDPLQTLNLSDKREYRQLIADARKYRLKFKRLKKSQTGKKIALTAKERERLKTLGYIQ
jgi:choline-sulfatase